MLRELITKTFQRLHASRGTFNTRVVYNDISKRLRRVKCLWQRPYGILGDDS